MPFFWINSTTEPITMADVQDIFVKLGSLSYSPVFYALLVLLVRCPNSIMINISCNRLRFWDVWLIVYDGAISYWCWVVWQTHWTIYKFYYANIKSKATINAILRPWVAKNFTIEFDIFVQFMRTFGTSLVCWVTVLDGHLSHFFSHWHYKRPMHPIGSISIWAFTNQLMWIFVRLSFTSACNKLHLKLFHFVFRYFALYDFCWNCILALLYAVGKMRKNGAKFH